MRLDTASTKETDIGLAEIDYSISIIGHFPDESRKGRFISGNPNCIPHLHQFANGQNKVVILGQRDRA